MNWYTPKQISSIANSYELKYLYIYKNTTDIVTYIVFGIWARFYSSCNILFIIALETITIIRFRKGIQLFISENSGTGGCGCIGLRYTEWPDSNSRVNYRFPLLEEFHAWVSYQLEKLYYSFRSIWSFLGWFTTRVFVRFQISLRSSLLNCAQREDSTHISHQDSNRKGYFVFGVP